MEKILLKYKDSIEYIKFPNYLIILKNLRCNKKI